jgi:transcription factor SPN1
MSDSELDNHPLSPRGDDDDDDLPLLANNSNLDMDESDLDKNGDLDSELSEVDEAEFADFDPTTVAVAVDERPVTIDDEVARTLKAAKRKRTDRDGEGGAKKPKEAKREKPKRKKTRTDLDAGAIDDGGDEYDSGADGEILEGKRRPKPKSTRTDGDRRDRERARRKEPEPEENEENLTPEERRKRALDRAMDAALKNPNKRRRKKDEVVRCSTIIANEQANYSSRISKKPLMRRLLP